jgi:hypothetical protein
MRGLGNDEQGEMEIFRPDPTSGLAGSGRDGFERATLDEVRTKGKKVTVMLGVDMEVLPCDSECVPIMFQNVA